MLRSKIMLVLTRKADQQIQIGNDVVITVLQVKGNSVRIGIEAPRQVRVMRSELQPLETGSQQRADLLDAPEMIVPAQSLDQMVNDVVLNGSAKSRRSVGGSMIKTSLRQEPADGVRKRAERCSPLLRFMAAGAATDAPTEWPTRSEDAAKRTAQVVSA